MSNANPPLWPASVVVFGPSDANITQTVAALSASLNQRSTGHFSTQRLALLFAPGTYDADVQVGYYTQVLGLGAKASDVVFNGSRGVFSPAMDQRRGGAGSLDTFWRGAEGFRMASSAGMLWAVSQAAPLRRLHIDHDLLLHDKGLYASGGFMANVQVGGTTQYGSQQQWFTRNCQLAPTEPSVMGGAWSLVFVGTIGAPPTHGRYASGGPAGAVRVSTTATTPIAIEKPFITVRADGLFDLRVPLPMWNVSGASLEAEPDRMRTVPFENVYVARNETDSAASLQAALAAGDHLVLTPGIYSIGSALTLSHPGQVLLGLGLATLTAPLNGEPCVRVLPGVPGVRVGGLMLQASNVSGTGVNMTSLLNTTSLLEWGSEGVVDPGSSSDPGLICDVYARTGGPDTSDTSVDVHVRIHSGHVIGDNVWLWRADHSALAPGESPSDPSLSEYHLVRDGEFRTNTGLEVFGDSVTMYGLAVEHTLRDLVRWSGSHGQTFFFQAELPYDATQVMGTFGRLVDLSSLPASHCVHPTCSTSYL